jgi:hypothetical protein
MVNILKSFMSRKNILLLKIIIFILLLALVGWFWYERRAENNSAKERNMDDWMQAKMEMSGISFYYPKQWKMQQGVVPLGTDKSEIVQLNSTQSAEEGYFCLDFRDSKKDDSLPWFFEDTERIKKKEQIKSQTANIELLYFNEADSVSETVVVANITANDREISVTASFNCGQSDGDKLIDKNASFSARGEWPTAKRILETFAW